MAQFPDARRIDVGSKPAVHRASLDLNEVPCLQVVPVAGERVFQRLVGDLVVGWRLDELAKGAVMDDERIVQVFVEVCDRRANADRVAALAVSLREGADIGDTREKWQRRRTRALREGSRRHACQTHNNQDRPGHPDEHGG